MPRDELESLPSGVALPARRRKPLRRLRALADGDVAVRVEIQAVLREHPLEAEVRADYYAVVDPPVAAAVLPDRSVRRSRHEALVRHEEWIFLLVHEGPERTLRLHRAPPIAGIRRVVRRVGKVVRVAALERPRAFDQLHEPRILRLVILEEADGRAWRLRLQGVFGVEFDAPYRLWFRAAAPVEIQRVSVRQKARIKRTRHLWVSRERLLVEVAKRRKRTDWRVGNAQRPARRAEVVPAAELRYRRRVRTLRLDRNVLPCPAEVPACPHEPRAWIEIPRVAFSVNDGIGQLAELPYLREAARGAQPEVVPPSLLGDRVAVARVSAHYADGHVGNRQRIAVRADGKKNR